MDTVESALNVGKEESNFLVVVDVVEPFANEECSEVLAAVLGAESVLVGPVSICCLDSAILFHLPH